MESALTDIIIRLGLGGAIGLSIGLTGVGGGVLVMPALTVVLGFPPTLAVGTATAFSSLSKVFAVYEHWRLKNVDFKVGTQLLIGAVLAAVIAAIFIANNTESAASQRALGWAITAAIAIAAALMLVRVFRPETPEVAEAKDVEPETPSGRPSARAVGLGAMIGALIASTSVGGGVVVMPVLVFGFPMSMRRVVGTAIFISLVVSTVTSGLYHFSGTESHVDVTTAGWLVAGSLLGIRVGSRLTEKIDDDKLTMIAVAMILLAVVAMTAKMLFS